MENQILLAKDVSYPFPKEMQATHHTIRTHALIVLAKLHLVVLHQFQHQVEITDITLNEGIVRLVLDVLEVSQITCVSQLVEVDDVILRIFVHEKSYYV